MKPEGAGLTPPLSLVAGGVSLITPNETCGLSNFVDLQVSTDERYVWVVRTRPGSIVPLAIADTQAAGTPPVLLADLAGFSDTIESTGAGLAIYRKSLLRCTSK